MRFFVYVFFVALTVSGCGDVGEDSVLPTINLETKEWVNYNRYALGRANFKLDTLKAYFKLRGGMSVRYEKKSLALDLGYDYSFNQSSGARRWILNANYIDKTFMRHKIAYDLFKEMDQDNKSPDCSYVLLERNSNKQGLYVLMKRLTPEFLGVNESGFVFKEPAIFRDSLHTLKIKSQKFPKRDDSSAYNQLLKFQLFIHQSTQKEFDQKIESYINLQSFADWFLLLLYSNNGDGVLKNFYLYKTSLHDKIKVAPWDYDHSWGRDGDNEKNEVSDIAENRSILFRKLLHNKRFCELIETRWEKHRKNVFSLENFNRHIIKNKNLIETSIL